MSIYNTRSLILLFVYLHPPCCFIMMFLWRL